MSDETPKEASKETLKEASKDPLKIDADPGRARDERPATDQRRYDWRQPADVLEALARFVSSGLFFMIVGSAFLAISYFTIGKTHAAMSFVLVVVGVAILLYGTGTQSMGQVDSGEGAAKVARYKVYLAGGAGVLAFCVAAGIIKFSDEMKRAFQIEQKYLRLQIAGKGYQFDDIGNYVPDVKINGNTAPAARRGDHIEVYVPYLLSPDPVRFEIRVRLHLDGKVGVLRQLAEGTYVVTLDPDGKVREGNATAGERYVIEGGYDFPRFALKEPVNLSNDDSQRVAGIAPQ